MRFVTHAETLLKKMIIIMKKRVINKCKVCIMFFDFTQRCSLSVLKRRKPFRGYPTRKDFFLLHKQVLATPELVLH